MEIEFRAAMAGSNNNGPEIFGLNEDGDFALVGINMKEESIVIQQQQQSTPGLNTYLDSLMTTMPSTTTTSTTRNEIDERFLGLMREQQQLPSGTGESTAFSFSPATPPFTTTSSSSTATAATIDRNDDNDNEHHAQVWYDKIYTLLQDVFPSLSEAERQRYTKGLLGIGFDPDCESRFYLREEDLASFMKVLHRRYFVAEIVGME